MFLKRLRRSHNPAVPLPWKGGKALPEGFTRPPSTDELIQSRRAARPEKWLLEPLPVASPVAVDVDDDVEGNDAGVLEGEFGGHFREDVGGGVSPGLRAWVGAPPPLVDASRSGDTSKSGPLRLAPPSAPSVWIGERHLLGFGESAVSVIGDVGGHRRCFDDVLDRLGVVGNHVPSGLVIVQVGDLIGGRNGLNRYLLNRVDELMAANPGRWVQLMGNWESRHIPGFTQFDARKDEEPLDASGVATLRRWWDDGLMQLGTAVRFEKREVLITHAGLTGWMWRDLGEPRSAEVAAELLNEAGKYATAFVGQSGEMCAPERSSKQWDARYERPGPLWASTKELWSSWHDEPVMPFDQVVGHTAPFYFNRDTWSPHLAGIAPEVLACAVPSITSRHVAFRSGGGVIHSIDPQLHARAAQTAIRTHDLGVAQHLR
jgi:hypothetical protein